MSSYIQRFINTTQISILYLPYFFIYKPSDFFSIWHESLVDFSKRNGVQLIAKGLEFKNSLIANEMTVNSLTVALFTWHALKLPWQQHISDHQSDSLLPMHWKTISLNSANLFSFRIRHEIFWSLRCENHSITCSSIVRSSWEWNGPFLHLLQSS